MRNPFEPGAKRTRRPGLVKGTRVVHPLVRDGGTDGALGRQTLRRNRCPEGPVVRSYLVMRGGSDRGLPLVETSDSRRLPSLRASPGPGTTVGLHQGRFRRSKTAFERTHLPARTIPLLPKRNTCRKRRPFEWPTFRYKESGAPSSNTSGWYHIRPPVALNGSPLHLPGRPKTCGAFDGSICCPRRRTKPSPSNGPRAEVYWMCVRVAFF